MAVTICMFIMGAPINTYLMEICGNKSVSMIGNELFNLIHNTMIDEESN